MKKFTPRIHVAYFGHASTDRIAGYHWRIAGDPRPNPWTGPFRTRARAQRHAESALIAADAESV